MNRLGTLFGCRSLLTAALLLAVSFPALAQEAEVARTEDAWCDFSVAVGQPWERTAFKGYTVPGAIRCVWAGPQNSSITIFLQEPGAAIDPRFILDTSVNTLKATGVVEVPVAEIRTIAEMQAMWMVTHGKGTGGAIDGTGETETTQHWVAIPREKDVLVLLLTCPKDEYAGLQESFEAAVNSLKVGGAQTAEQQASK